jgi:hypothetical protein
VFTTGATMNEAEKMVPGTFMYSHWAECLWKKGLAFNEDQFFLQAEIRRSKGFCSA